MSIWTPSNPQEATAQPANMDLVEMAFDPVSYTHLTLPTIYSV